MLSLPARRSAQPPSCRALRVAKARRVIWLAHKILGGIAFFRATGSAMEEVTATPFVPKSDCRMGGRPSRLAVFWWLSQFPASLAKSSAPPTAGVVSCPSRRSLYALFFCGYCSCCDGAARGGSRIHACSLQGRGCAHPLRHDPPLQAHDAKAANSRDRLAPDVCNPHPNDHSVSAASGVRPPLVIGQLRHNAT